MIEIDCEAGDTLREGAPCLHCLVESLVVSYWEQFGIRNSESGRVAFDVTLTLAKLAEVMANIALQVSPECGVGRTEVIESIHEIFDGIVEAIETGDDVSLAPFGNKGRVH